MALVLHLDGSDDQIVIKDGEKGLKQIQKLVDGYVEPVNTPQGQVLYVNEDGHMKHLQVNRIASTVAGQLILGTAVLCDKGEWKDED